MHPQFAELTPTWFNRAFVYTGSIGEFRYRFAGDKDNGGKDLQTDQTYGTICPTMQGMTLKK